MYYVYVLQSDVTGRHYTGSAADVEERLRRHNSGDTKSTRHGIPWRVIYKAGFATRQAAVQRELYLKTGRGRKELEKLCAVINIRGVAQPG